METLNDDLYEQIATLCQEGDNLVNANDYTGGLHKYHQAWALLPEPKEDWDAATWLLSSIGDAHFFARDYKNAIAALTNALRCPNGLGNPFIHLRLGESYFELDDVRAAQDELARAYMGSGKNIFQNENPKYFAFLQSVLLPPLGQSSL